MKLGLNPLCSGWKQVFTKAGLRIPIPAHWVAEFHQIDSAARTLGPILAKIRSGEKPRILARWEKDLTD